MNSTNLFRTQKRFQFILISVGGRGSVKIRKSYPLTNTVYKNIIQLKHQNRQPKNYQTKFC